mmetsp:Transcript_5581/g.12939  ORF Transcript_5581/g.12939 Transcript_5581/m.12939 type:complete len:209 (-) Transcript_5581:1088-1714(-)
MGGGGKHGDSQAGTNLFFPFCLFSSLPFSSFILPVSFPTLYVCLNTYACHLPPISFPSCNPPLPSPSLLPPMYMHSYSHAYVVVFFSPSVLSHLCILYLLPHCVIPFVCSFRPPLLLAVHPLSSLSPPPPALHPALTECFGRIGTPSCWQDPPPARFGRIEHPLSSPTSPPPRGGGAPAAGGCRLVAVRHCERAADRVPVSSQCDRSG